MYFSGKYMDILKEAFTFSNENIGNIKFNVKSLEATTTICIFLSMIELARSTHVLLEARSYTGPYSIYRTFLECYVDLINISKDRSYLKLLELEYCSRQFKRSEIARSGNKYYSSLNKLTEFHDSCNEFKIKSESIKNEFNIKRKTIKCKFETAGLMAEYEAIYSKLSTETHCSIESIINRHIERDDESDSLSVIIYNEKRSGDFDYYIAEISRALAHAGILTCEILKSDALQLFSERYSEINLMIKKSSLLNI